MLLVLQRQDDLDQAGDAGRRLEVADVGLDRADQQRRVGGAARARARRPAPGPRSDRRAWCRCRAPRRSRRRPARSPASASAARITASCAGPFGTVSPPLRPSWLTARAADDGQDAVAVGLRVGQPLEHEHAAALAAREAVGRRVEGLAAAVGRHHVRLGQRDRRLRRAHQVDAAGQRQPHSPLRRLWQARCSATSDDEQAVSTDSAGPCRPST